MRSANRIMMRARERERERKKKMTWFLRWQNLEINLSFSLSLYIYNVFSSFCCCSCFYGSYSSSSAASASSSSSSSSSFSSLFFFLCVYLFQWTLVCFLAKRSHTHKRVRAYSQTNKLQKKDTSHSLYYFRSSYSYFVFSRCLHFRCCCFFSITCENKQL